jgi:hypothetical protein
MDSQAKLIYVENYTYKDYGVHDWKIGVTWRKNVK